MLKDATKDGHFVLVITKSQQDNSHRNQANRVSSYQLTPPQQSHLGLIYAC